MEGEIKALLNKWWILIPYSQILADWISIPEVGISTRDADAESSIWIHERGLDSFAGLLCLPQAGFILLSHLACFVHE